MSENDKLNEVLDGVKETMQAFDEYKDAQEKKQTDSDALLDEKIQKTTDVMLDALEKQNKANAEIAAVEKARLDKIEAAIARVGSGGGEEEKADVGAELHSEWIRKSNYHGTFEDFVGVECDKRGLDVKALSVNSDPDGGFMVVPERSAMIITRMFETSPIRPIANIETIGTDALEIPIDNDEAASGGWIGEETTPTETGTPTIDLKRIVAQEQFAEPRATTKLLDDAEFDAETWLANKTADKLVRTENTAFVTGDGIAKPRGFMTYADWASAGTYESGAVEQFSTGSSTTYTYNALVNIQNGLLEVYQANAAWLTKRANFGLIMQIVDGDTRPIFNLTFDKNTGLAGGIMGKSLMFADDIAAAATGALSIAYGDMRATYTIVDRRGLRVLRDPFTVKPFVLFYTTKRTGGDVVNFESLKIGKQD